MVYVALLRGINVGGNNKVEMAKLKITFERLGFSDVKTYINSGNIIFRETLPRPQSELVPIVENAIEKDFGLSIKILLRDKKNIQMIANNLPSSWVNDQATKCDIMFLWEECDSPDIVKQLAIKPTIDEVKYVKGALLWRVSKRNITKSGLMTLAGTKLYKKMTVRNANTLRKLAAILAADYE